MDQTEKGERAVSVFELSQALLETWDRADLPTEHMILDTACLNLTWVNESLSVTARSPFHLLAKNVGVQIGGPCRT